MPPRFIALGLAAWVGSAPLFTSFGLYPTDELPERLPMPETGLLGVLLGLSLGLPISMVGDERQPV